MAESYVVIKDDTNKFKVIDAEVSVMVNNKATTAIVKEIEFTYEQLQEAVNLAQKQYDNFKKRTDFHLAKFQSELDLARTRLEAAKQLDIISK